MGPSTIKRLADVAADSVSDAPRPSGSTPAHPRRRSAAATAIFEGLLPTLELVGSHVPGEKMRARREWLPLQSKVCEAVRAIDAEHRAALVRLLVPALVSRGISGCLVEYEEQGLGWCPGYRLAAICESMCEELRREEVRSETPLEDLDGLALELIRAECEYGLEEWDVLPEHEAAAHSTATRWRHHGALVCRQLRMPVLFHRLHQQNLIPDQTLRDCVSKLLHLDDGVSTSHLEILQAVFSARYESMSFLCGPCTADLVDVFVLRWQLSPPRSYEHLVRVTTFVDSL
jgi:hypothetical protein